MLEALLTGHGSKTWPQDDFFHGEIPSGVFITPEALAATVGLTAGNLINPTAPWLSFTLDGAEVLVPKLPIRTNLRWNELQSLGLVFGKTITINGGSWLVRLMRGGTADPTPNQTGNDVAASWGSEWNRLMYRITGVVSNPANSEGLTTGDKERYTNAELGVGVGFRNICQETITGYPLLCVHRGSSHITHFGGTAKSNQYHWRPILVKV